MTQTSALTLAGVSGGRPSADLSQYLRDLGRSDQLDQTVLRLRSLIADGIDSGGGRRLTDVVVGELRRRSLDSAE